MGYLSSNTIYRIQAKHSGRVLAIGQASMADVNVIQWDWQGGPEQQFRAIDHGNGVYTLQAVHSGKVLDVAGGSRDNGAHVIQYVSTGVTNQQFRLIPMPDGNNVYFCISPCHSGKNLGISEGRQDNGADLIQWDNDGGYEQRFAFIAL